MVCWNASQAARESGYRGQANVVGPRLLANVRIRQLVKQRLSEVAMEADEVLARLTDEARGSLDDFIDDKGNINLLQARERGKMHLLKSYSTTNRGERIEIYDAQAAKVHIGRHHALFTDRVLFDPSRLTDDQLKHAIAQLAAETGATSLVPSGSEAAEAEPDEPDEQG